MKKFIYLLLALPLLMVSCEPDSADPHPMPEPVLTLISNSVIEFEVEGGSAEIIYTLENAIEGVDIVAECDAKWVAYKVFASESKISLNVEANDGDAREATLVVKYDMQEFVVVLKQETKPFEGYELSYIAGTYYAPGSEFNPTESHNYYVALSSIDDFSTYAPNGVYVELDLWAATADATNPVVPNGEYVIDTTNSGAPGTIGAGYSRLLEMDANQSPIVWVLPIEGKVVVSDNKIEGYLLDEYSEKVWFRYTGSLSVNVE
ncbi:MAG: BACON domain-containing protein [Alistipes sp.]|nr:BACON domain-containing protein [Alistipes sp.]